MTSYVTVIRYEPAEEGAHAKWVVWVNERGKEREWLLTDDRNGFPIGQTFQI